MTTITSPLPFFADLDGSPLDGGKVYIGTANANPETSPITVYWDSALTQPAAQPLRTAGGLIVRSGTPAQVYVSADYSMTVRDSRGRLVLSAQNSTDYNLGQQIVTVNAAIGTAIADLKADLLSTSASRGETLIAGPNHQLSYAASTLGRHLVESDALVTDYPWSADKTGVADAQSAIQSCINYWALKGISDGVIYRVRVPAGKYKLGSKIMTCDSASSTGQVSLIGDGPFATRFEPTGNFTAVNLVSSYVPCGGFSVGWSSYGGTTARVGVEFASADSQVSQCRVFDILVQNAGRGFYLADWTGQPYGTVYLLTLSNLLAFNSSDWGFYFDSKTGSTTLELQNCYANGGNGSGTAANKGAYFSNINEVTGTIALDKCVDQWIEIKNANFCDLYFATESCQLVTDAAVGITINSAAAAVRGLKDISNTYSTTGVGSVRILGMGTNCAAMTVAGYNRQGATIGGTTTVYTVTLNAAASRLSILDRSILPAAVQNNGWFANVTYNGITFGTSFPNYGTWGLGDYVRNVAPSVGTPKGWVCTVAGTSGTWVSEGNL